MVTKAQQRKAIPAYKRIMDKMKSLGAIMPFEESMVSRPRTWIQSPMWNMNWALGHGVPFGCLWELIGAESSSKSSLALSLAAALQKSHNALVIPYDTERMDDAMIQRTGLDLTMTAIPEPEARDSIANVVNNMMQMIEAIQDANDEGSYDEDGPAPVIIIWDSVAATATQTIKQAVANKRAGQSVGIVVEQMSAAAAQLSVALKTLHPAIVKANILAIFINQMRVDMQTQSSWGGPGEHSGGGRALKHAANLRGQVRYQNQYSTFNAGKRDLTYGNQNLGITCTMEMIKNKLAAPFKKIEFVNMFASGIDVVQSNLLHAIYDLSEAQLIPLPVRGRFDYADKKYTFSQLVDYFKNNPSAYQELGEKVADAQKRLDELITPDEIDTLQRKADSIEQAETHEAEEESNDDE